jgi:ArsR family transcriptional regulator
METFARFLKASADPTRLRILNLLLHNELAVCDLQRILQIPQPAVSRHLAHLKGAGLVHDRRDRLRVYYALCRPASPRMAALFDCYREVFRGNAECRGDLLALRHATRTGEVVGYRLNS